MCPWMVTIDSLYPLCFCYDYRVYIVAEWTPSTTKRMPLKQVLQYGPGLDCLRYAEWTPENTKQPMFTKTMHSKCLDLRII